MLFNNYLLFAGILSFILVYNISRWLLNNRIINEALLLAGNLILILQFVKEHTYLVLAGISLVVFVGARLLQKKKSKLLFAFLLSLIVILFSVRNYPYLQDLLSDTFLDFITAPVLSVQKLGLSYILFRFVHFLIESKRGTIHDSNFFTFLNYIFFFPTILAGPIDNYKNFHFWMTNKRKGYTFSLALAGVSRILIGGVKTMILVPIIIQEATDYTILVGSYGPILGVLLSLFCYSLYIYLDFSGYCDIAIGTAYMLGIKTPENFNNPYFASNLSVFWKKWHMTFSNFLLAYVFKPIIQLLNFTIRIKARLPITIMAYVFTFTICGLWHGDKINFVYWGLWHGIGLALNKIWTIQLEPKWMLSKKSFYKPASVFLTFSFVTVGWGFFHYSQQELIEIFNLIQE
jgi:alginate O-acetyltransferase complex protein AlgI